MSVRVLKASHPKIMLVHLRNAVRTVCERDATFFERGNRQSDVGAAEIDTALGFEIGRVLCFVKEQTHSRAVEERQVAEPV